MHYVAKVELFEKRWQGWVLSRLGAFPIRRGEADEDAMATARGVLERGGAVCIFPEGTRTAPGRSRARGVASAGWRSRPVRRSSLSPSTGPSRSAAAGESGPARSSCGSGAR